MIIALVALGLSLLSALFTGWYALETRRMRRDNKAFADEQIRQAKASSDAAERSANAAESSTKAAEVSAQAGKAGADALVKSEQAWIMVDIDLLARPGILHNISVGGQPQVEKTAVSLVCTCRNLGKTPAWITEKKICFEILDHSMPTLDYLDSLVVEQYAPEYLGAGKESDPQKVISEAYGREEPGKMMMVFGAIRYRDMFGNDNRRTTFAYRIIRGSNNGLLLERVNTPEWLKNT